MRFNPVVEHVSGSDLVIADTLSRSPMPHTESDELCATEVSAYVESLETRSFSATKLNDVKVATDRDEELQTVIDYTLSGWPEYIRDVPVHLRKYFEIRSHLSVSGRLLLYDDRIYVPKSLQSDILVRIHDGHQGINKCRERARSAVYWIGISQAIKDVVQNCPVCQTNQNVQRHEPLNPTPLPDRPWQKLAVDLADHDKCNYVILVDYYSRYIETAPIAELSTNAVVTVLKSLFSRWGLPDTLISDNGPQFASQEFANFCAQFGISQVTSSPHYPQSNGEVERAVQTAKSLLRQEDSDLALMIYRATPTSPTGFSPSQLLMGRQIKTTLPILD
jgi:hypothetical protein